MTRCAGQRASGRSRCDRSRSAGHLGPIALQFLARGQPAEPDRGDGRSYDDEQRVEHRDQQNILLLRAGEGQQHDQDPERPILD
ncbi:MAG: hypothetical protein ACK56I_15915, partial [bacterium]